MPQNVGPATYSGRARAAPGASIENPRDKFFGVSLAHPSAVSSLLYALSPRCCFDFCARFVLSEILAAGVPPASVGPLCARPQPRRDAGGPKERRSQGLRMLCGRFAPPVRRGRLFRAHQRPPSIASCSCMQCAQAQALLTSACRYDHGGCFGRDSDRAAAVFCRNKAAAASSGTRRRR